MLDKEEQENNQVLVDPFKFLFDVDKGQFGLRKLKKTHYHLDEVQVGSPRTHDVSYFTKRMQWYSS